MKIGYADPPYPGQSRRHYKNHPDYAGEVDHEVLIKNLQKEFDGWVLHTSSVALNIILPIVPDARILAWVKPFAAFKRNVPVAYAWEPVLIKPCRKPIIDKRYREELNIVSRDWLAKSITLKKGLTGVKPERLCWWLFYVIGADLNDELIDLFPGTGAVTRAWQSWQEWKVK